ncbi:MSHA pilin protein MshC [Massilia violacea]|uniref:MSHA pilin protein MshC n=2 Tax=Pseudoduganella violacea TaxID=1715466 RepID=A0A7W5BE51_9BURK|nr:MSHA pilin protein MshC [Pseudoduganella violacea]
MVELVTVMVLLGILSAIAIPRMLSDPGMAGPGFRADIVTALRYAQKSAVGHRRVVWATVNNNSVTLLIAANNPAATNAAGNCIGVPLATPDGAAFTSTKAATNFTAAAPLVLFFQPNGEITTDCAGVNLASNSITVSAAAQNEAAITIIGVSGRVD